MARTKYHLEVFNSEKAKGGSLCVMVATSISVDSDIFNYISTVGDNDDYFKGAGIARYRSSGSKFEFTVNGETYLFNSAGTADSSAAVNWKLVMGTIVESVDYTGNAYTSTNTGHTTKNQDGSITKGDTTYTGRTILIDNLNARDQFAVQILNGIITKFDIDPATLSSSAKSFYCQQAYEWAANMMTAAANARGEFTDQTETTADAQTKAIGTIESTTDKLLNNLIVALQRTDKAVTTNGTTTYVEQTELSNMSTLIDKMTATDTIITALKENLTNAMTQMTAAMATMNGHYQSMVNQLQLINSSLQAYTSTMDTNMNAVTNSVALAREDISGVSGKVDTANNKITSATSTLNTVNTNLNTVKYDVGIIKTNTNP